MSQEAMKLALDGKSLYDITGSITDIDKCIIHRFDLIQALAALAKQEQGEPVACKRCGGSGVVDDGEIDCYEDGTPYENGPIKCVKDCPDCTTPYVPTGRQQRKPLKKEMAKQMKERCDSMEMRGAFADGWLSAEAAYNIKE